MPDVVPALVRTWRFRLWNNAVTMYEFRIFTALSCFNWLELFLNTHRAWLALFAYLENEYVGGLRFARIPKQPVNMHGRLVEDIASAVDFGWVWINLTLDLSPQDVGENGPGVLVRSRRSRSRGRYQRHYGHLLIWDVCQLLLYERFRGGRQSASVLEDENLRGFRLAQVSKEAVDLHRSLVEKVARVVELGRFGFDLILDITPEGCTRRLPLCAYA